MHPRNPILAIAVTAVALTGCSTGAMMSLQGVAPAGKSQALVCATQQLIHLGYTIDAGDSVVGFVRGEKSFDKDTRDVLTATVFDDATTGAASLRVTAARRTSSNETDAPRKRGSADADSIMATCAGQTASEGQGDASR